MTEPYLKKPCENNRIEAAIASLVECVQEQSQHITGIRKAQKEKIATYQETFQNFSKLRGSDLWYPYLSSGIGKGPFVELLDGSVKYDFISGVGVHYFGHSHPKIIEATLRASLRDTVMQGNLQQTTSNYEFSEKLLTLAKKQGARLDHVFLTSTGVMAGENALKMALQKNYPAERLLAFEGCFAGRTLTFSQITDKSDYRIGLPTTLPVDYIPFFDKDDPQESQKKAIEALKKFIKRYPKQYACMFFELMLGEAGYYEGSSDFHRALMEICKENNIAVLIDEVQTFARTTSPFMFQYYHLDEFVDIVWVGKSTQVCATLFSAEMCPKAGLLSQTFTSSETAIVAGKVVLDLLEAGGYWGENGKIALLSASLKESLKAIAKRHPKIFKGPYGNGMMMAFSIFDGDTEKTKKFLQALFQNGVIAFIGAGQNTRIRLLPPVGAIKTSHIHEVCNIIENTLMEFK